ncbi:MAG TPA: acetyl-CoA carboxylase biotin carboxyl carrier protein [Candidatus Sulfotelmatobacter sp.]|nr:acetyl-CoA carboxylase biotin carboxyl carrier protein [Candidatus Sulfotelmatobacter sp.]
MDLKELKTLLRLMDTHDLEELEVEEGGRRVRIRRRGAGGIAAAAPAASPAPVAATLRAPGAEDASGLVPITAPMVGTFYRAPSPGAEAFVKEGDLVQKGTVLCIIEAMKLMNEIEAESKGRIARILVENGQPVEFGQTLFLLGPA